MEAKVYHSSQVDSIVIIYCHRSIFHLLPKVDGHGVGWREFFYVPLTTVIEQLNMLPRN
jgi:hypothetical protein